MRERPIMFSAPMIRALLAGKKTQTRRLVGLDTLQRSETPGYDWTWRGRAPIRSIAQQRRHPDGCWQDVTSERMLSLCPYGVPGDRLWVRETWAAQHDFDAFKPSEINWDARWHYAATEERGGLLWRSPLFMPRWASRITLENTEVRVQRLHDITEADAKAEGVEPFFARFPSAGRDQALDGELCADAEHRASFKCLWDEINGDRALWVSSPWVWAVSFQPVTP